MLSFFYLSTAFCSLIYGLNDSGFYHWAKKSKSSVQDPGFVIPVMSDTWAAGSVEGQSALGCVRCLLQYLFVVDAADSPLQIWQALQ